MATAEQIKSLIRSHLSMNAEQFYASALQIAAHEARQGHTALANDIRELVDRARKKSATTNVIAFPQELAGLILSEQPSRPLASLVVDDALKARIERVILEFRQQHKLKKHGLNHRRKLLLSGEPGTGKTMTAQVLATELKQPLHIIQMDRLVTKFMGETGAKLRQIFERIRAMPGVYLFDEFDAIGGERDLGNDVGEMRRVLNAFLQFIENDISNNLIIAATNNPRLLDRALFRRFDDVLHYALPDDDSRKHLIANLLGTFRSPQFPLDKAAQASQELSHSEIDRACRDAIKLAILSNKSRVTYTSFNTLLKERHAAYQGKEK
ncbi:MAG: ATP-binding protein [Deltaproteobacteria bacterium]|nr:ATP-binding protein [Deltaproteobacteria bacterium]